MCVCVRACVRGCVDGDCLFPVCFVTSCARLCATAVLARTAKKYFQSRREGR